MHKPNLEILVLSSISARSGSVSCLVVSHNYWGMEAAGSPDESPDPKGEKVSVLVTVLVSVIRPGRVMAEVLRYGVNLFGCGRCQYICCGVKLLEVTKCL